MGLVKNTKQQALALMAGDMSWDKKDALNVNSSSTGKGCGVLVVVGCSEQNLVQKD
jgi:hypothetical protein